ncbi:MAG: glycosyltransferase family 2 protein [Bacteroidota bacterium]
MVSVVIPLYNDEEVIAPLLLRLVPVLERMEWNFQVIFVDDGSSDKSWQTVCELKKTYAFLTGIKLARNFGQQNAISAGLDNAQGEIIVLMDSDLQDRPEDIPKLVDKLLKSDASMAIAKWKTRKDSRYRLLVSKLFYKISQRLTTIKHEPNLGVFRAIRKSVVDELKNYQEKTSTTLSILYWIGADYVTVELERDERQAGKSGYNLSRMLGLALGRIFSFSMFPIRLATYFGLVMAFLSFVTGLFLILRRLNGVVAPGWTSVTVIILFMSGVNFFFLGILGEYIGRTFLEAKQRPRYVVRKVI